MKIGQVQGQDFLALESVTFNLTDIGLVGVQGVNKDDESANSNGSGKSSLPDLVNWILWGTTARGTSGDKVIRRNGTTAHGFLELIDDAAGEDFRIIRERKKGKETLGITGSDGAGGRIDLTLGTLPLTQEVIERIVGCSEEVFRAAVYLGQEAMPNLPGMTDKQLKELVEEAAGVEVLEQAYDKAKGRATEANTSHQGRVRELAVMTAKLTTLNDQVIAEKALAATWGDTLQAKIKATTEEMELKETERDTAVGRIDTVLKTKLDQAVAQIDAQIGGFAEERKREAELMAVCADTHAEAARTGDVVARARKTTLSCDKALVEVNGKVGENCGECGTVMDASHICVAHAAASKRLEDASEQLLRDVAAHTAAQECKREAEEVLAAHRATMRDPTTLNAKRAQLQAGLEKIQERIRAAQEMTRVLTDMEKTLADMRIEKNPHQATVERLQTQIGLVTSSVDGHTNLVVASEVMLGHEKQAVEVFGPGGVRAHILDNVTPFLNEQTSLYLTLLSDGNIQAAWTTLIRNAKGELREKFSIEVTSTSGGDGFKELSGGEKRKVRLACAMALQDLVASRATKPFGLWIGDEIDHALDEAGLERLMSVLQLKAQDRGTVLVISHNSLKDWLPNTWTVTKSGGKSTLVTLIQFARTDNGKKFAFPAAPSYDTKLHSADATVVSCGAWGSTADKALGQDDRSSHNRAC